MTARKVTVDLLDTDESLIEADLQYVGGAGSYYSEEIGDAAASGVIVPDVVAGAGDLDEDLLLRFKLNGTTDHTARIETVDAVRKSVNPSDRLVTVTARDWLSEFDDAVIDPPMGVDSLPTSTVVRFDWTHPQLDRTGWVAPTFLGNLWTADLDPFGTPMGPPMNVKDGAAVEAWTDPFTGWVYSAPMDGNGSHPGGTSYFHLPLGGLIAGPFLPLFTADDYGQLAFDNVLIDDGVEAPEVQWTQTWASGIEQITAGTHHICAKVTNDAAYGPVANPGAFAFIAYQRKVSNWLVYQNIVARTADFVGGSDPLLGGGWKCLHHPTTAPGFTWGKACRLMFNQAQASGHLTGWTLGFTDTNDSNGNPWPVTEEITATVNDTHLAWFAQSQARGFAEVGARPGQRVLDAFRWGQRGDYWVTASPLVWDDDNITSVRAKRVRSGV